jgi:hypothetical protein
LPPALSRPKRMTQCSSTGHDRCIRAGIGLPWPDCSAAETLAADAIKAIARISVAIVRTFMWLSWPVGYSDRLLDCGAFHRAPPEADTADVESRHTSRSHEILFVHGARAVNACWSWSCRSRGQSRGARGRSYSNRSAEIAGSAQPGLQRLNQAQVRGRQWISTLVLQAATR